MTRTFSSRLVIVLAALSPLQAAAEDPTKGELAKWQAHRDRLKADPSLIVYYTFDESTGPKLMNRATTGRKQLSVGGIAIEETTSPTDGDVIGAKWEAKSRVRGKTCLVFNGKGTDRVACGKPPVINNLKEKTLAAWIKVAGKGAFGQGRILCKTGTNAGAAYSPGWVFCISNPDENGIFHLAYTQNYSEHVGEWSCATELEVNQWYHVAVTHDNSSDRNPPVFYIDGEPQRTSVNQGGRGEPSDDSCAKLTIGAMTDSEYWALEGEVDEVTIHNRILSEEEMQKLCGH